MRLHMVFVMDNYIETFPDVLHIQYIEGVICSLQERCLSEDECIISRTCSQKRILNFAILK